MGHRSLKDVTHIPLQWEEPPVTKEEALNPWHAPNGAYTPDGFDGGAELPDDLYVDRLVYPHAAGPDEKASMAREHDRHMQAEKIRGEAFERSRSFDLDEDEVLGKAGTPDPFKS